MSEIVNIDTPELQVLEESKAEKIKKTFEPMANMLAEFEERYNELMAIPLEEITVDLTKEYKRLRLEVGRVRIETGKLKDKQKEYIKLEDKAIMGVHNILVWAVKEKEDNLKERENYFQIQEQKRIEKLQADRAEKLSLYIEDAHERDLAKFADDEFEALLTMKKTEYEDNIKAKKQAENERLEQERKQRLHQSRKDEILDAWQFVDEETKSKDFSEFTQEGWTQLKTYLVTQKHNYEEEQKRIRTEKERLQKEAELKEKRNKELRPYIVFIRDYDKMLNMSESDYEKEFSDIKRGAEDHWEWERKEQIRKAKEEEAERKAKEEERAEYEAKLKAEREEKERIEREEKAKREKLESELKAKEEAERKAKEEEEARLQAELNKGDAEKVKDLISDLSNLKSKYKFKSKNSQKMYSEVSQLIDKVVSHIKQK